MKKYNVFKLPSNFNLMEEFISKNKVFLTEKVLDSISYAIENDLQDVDVFTFDNDQEYYITLPVESFFNNLKMIYEFYIQDEKYELCQRLVDLQNKLKNHNI